MGAAEIRRKAATGAALVAARGLGIRIFALAGNIVFARLLVPSEFGTLAVGLSVLAFAAMLSDGGLGASLIRRPEPPETADLRALLALQIGGALAIAIPVVTVGLLLGGVGSVAAVMILALPIMALRGPGMVVLERRLSFGPVAAVEVGEVLAYYVWGITAVALGFGVWGLATASIARAVVGTAALLRLAPDGVLLPSASRARIRSLLSFGLRFQGVQVIAAVREHGVNFGTAAIAGLATLGFWTLALRVLQLPLLLFESLWRVSFPAMGQLIATGEDPRPIMERAAGLAAVGSGLLVTLVAGPAPAVIPAVFGPQWTETAIVLPAVCLGLQINGPVSSAVAGYLFASGRAGTVLRASVLGVVAAFVISFALLPLLGVLALGLGYLAVSLVETVIFTRAARAAVGASLIRPLLLPLAAAVTASSAAWVLSSALEPTLLVAAAGCLLGAGIYGVAMLLTQRAVVLDFLRIARLAIKRRRHAATAAEDTG